jgi:hypothetical protein
MTNLTHTPLLYSNTQPQKTPRARAMRLAGLSMICGVLSPLLMIAANMASVMVIMDDSGSLHRAWPSVGVFLFIFVLVSISAPIIALISGGIAFALLKWGNETIWRIVALVGIGLGGWTTAVTWFPVATRFWHG